MDLRSYIYGIVAAERVFVIAGGVDVSLVQDAVKLVDGRLETEASGNVTLATVAIIASTGVSYISCGSLTHSVTALDISLNIEL